VTPVISIIMPCYNGARHLAQGVASVQAQTRTDWQLVIVDDGSSDDSWAVMQSLAEAEPRIVPVRQDNAGAAAARNHGLKVASGRLIAFLDADDTWHPDFLALMSDALAGREDTALAYCGWQNVGLGREGSKPFVPPDYEGPGKTEALLGGCRWPIHGAMLGAAAIRLHGDFDTALSSCMDYDLWLRLGCRLTLVRVPEVLAFYHFHDGEQITKNRSRIAFNHLRAQRKFLAANPGVEEQLGTEKVRALTDGELLHRAYTSYWKGDLATARPLFRAVMASRYGSAKDWLYMLPALLPLPLHRLLLRMLRTRSAPDSPR
jgi:glycosyltransferase involved in cell wall biosynthesis